MSDSRPGRDRAAFAADATRAVAVMSGGPAVLGVWALAGTWGTVRAIRRGHRPPIRALLGPVIVLTYLAARPWTRRWHATPAEVAAALPGDEFVPDAGVTMTRAVTIDAPPDVVWPWIVQIGQDRAGFYSYTPVENLAGCAMRNADRVHDEWQDRALGDAVPLHPLNALPVTRLDPGRTYALGGWYFNLVPLGTRQTRLIARTRVPRGLASLAYAAFVEAPHFLMERRMLLSLKALIEHAETRPEPRVTAGPGPEPARAEAAAGGRSVG